MYSIGDAMKPSGKNQSRLHGGHSRKLFICEYKYSASYLACYLVKVNITDVKRFQSDSVCHRKLIEVHIYIDGYSSILLSQPRQLLPAAPVPCIRSSTFPNWLQVTGLSVKVDQGRLRHELVPLFFAAAEIMRSGFDVVGV